MPQGLSWNKDVPCWRKRVHRARILIRMFLAAMIVIRSPAPTMTVAPPYRLRRLPLPDLGHAAAVQTLPLHKEAVHCLGPALFRHPVTIVATSRPLVEGGAHLPVHRPEISEI